MLDEISLEAAVRQLTGVARSGTFSRCVGYHHLAATQPSQPLWGIGSKRFGGRFTPRNSFETIYLAEDPVTALAEVSAVLLNPGGQAGGGEPPTQLLGRVCHKTALFDAIRYPSSKNLPGGRCLAVFTDRLKGPAYLEVYDPNGHLAQRLP